MTGVGTVFHKTMMAEMLVIFVCLCVLKLTPLNPVISDAIFFGTQPAIIGLIVFPDQIGLQNP